MDDKEKVQYARDWRDISFETANMSIKRAAELESEYTRLEVQIAVILFAFSGIFVDKFDTLSGKVPISIDLLVRPAYGLGVIMLLVSLTMGLLHLKNTAKWWLGFLQMRDARMNKWNEVIAGSCTYEEALAFHKGASLGRTGIAESPSWTWVTQTICLGVAVVLFFAVFIVFLLT